MLAVLVFKAKGLVSKRMADVQMFSGSWRFATNAGRDYNDYNVQWLVNRNVDCLRWDYKTSRVLGVAWVQGEARPYACRL